MTSISKTLSSLDGFLKFSEALEPLKIVGNAADLVVGPFARWGSLPIFDLTYRLMRLPLSIIYTSNAVGNRFGIPKLTAGMAYRDMAAAQKNFWSASRIVECYAEFKESFIDAGFRADDDYIHKSDYNPEKDYNKASSAHIAVRRISFAAATLSAISENLDYWGADRIAVVASTLNQFKQIPGLSFALSSFSHGDQFFKLVSLTFSLINDGMTIYKRSQVRNCSVWEAATFDEVRKALVDKVGKLFLITCAGTLVPEWNRTRTLSYCTIGFIVDLNGVYGVYRKYQFHCAHQPKGPVSGISINNRKEVPSHSSTNGRNLSSSSSTSTPLPHADSSFNRLATGLSAGRTNGSSHPTPQSHSRSNSPIHRSNTSNSSSSSYRTTSAFSTNANPDLTSPSQGSVSDKKKRFGGSNTPVTTPDSHQRGQSHGDLKAKDGDEVSK